jgi:hypothetical protein
MISPGPKAPLVRGSFGPREVRQLPGHRHGPVQPG